MMNSKYPYGILIIFLLAACDPGSQRRIQRDALLEEMENREPKRLTEAQIVTEAFETGREIAGLASKELFLRLGERLQQEKADPHLVYENLELSTFTDSLSQVYQASIRRPGLKKGNTADTREELEQQLIDAYLYNQENNIALEDNVQTMGQDYLLYTSPIVLPMKVASLSPETEGPVKTGKLLGVWSILLSRKELVINM